jgi:hypothetical protein
MTRTPPPNAPGRSDRVLGQGSLTPHLNAWWDELLWPRVFGAARYGLRPGRMGIALFALLGAALLLELGLWLDARILHRDLIWPEPLRLVGGLPWLWDLFVNYPKTLIVARPITVLITGPAMLFILAAAAGAISRMTACEVSLGETPGWTEGLAFALARRWSLLGALLGPLVLIWGISALLVAGGLLGRWPVVNIVGSLFYGLALLAGFLAVMLMLIYILAHHLMIPAVVCEGTDAIDAIQRGYRYILARPARAVVYTVLGAAGWALVVGVVAFIAVATLGFTARATSAGTGDWHWMVWKPTVEAAAALGHPLRPMPPLNPGTYGVAAGIIGFWTLLPVGLVYAAFFSCGTALHTVLYLALRRLCDGQDFAELWVPGMIAGTMAVSLEGRARVAATTASPPGEQADYQ